MLPKTVLLSLLACCLVSTLALLPAHGAVVKKDGRVYIVDQHGEHWDVTQAQSIGFRPDRFQFGIGRHAFKTLDDSNLSDSADGVSSSARVIGVETDGGVHAYSVRKLARHEIANTIIGGTPIAAGY